MLRATLPNGLRVVIVRNTLAPVVSTAVNYLVGGDETPKGFPGTAHALEHMMFRGSPGLTADQLANIGSVMGGNFNANTRESITQYLFTVPSEDLDIALHIEAIAHAGRRSIPKRTGTRSAAPSSRRWRRTSPTRPICCSRSCARSMFAGTPYEHDALGTRPTFDTTTADDAQAFLRQLVRAQQRDPGDRRRRRSQGDARQGARAVRSAQEEEAAGAARRSISQPPKASSFEHGDRQVGREQRDRDAHAGHREPRFPRARSALRRAREPPFRLSTAWSRRARRWMPTSRSIRCRRRRSPMPRCRFPRAAMPRPLEAEMRAILAKVKKDGVPPELVAAAKMQEERATEFQKNGIEDLAAVWSDAVALYGLRSPDDDYARIEKVTVADVNRVGAQISRSRPRGRGDDDAQGLGPSGRGRRRASAARRNSRTGETKPTDLPDWAKTALGRLDVPPSTLSPMVSTLAQRHHADRPARGRERHGQRLRPYPQPPRDRDAAGPRTAWRSCWSNSSPTARTHSTASRFEKALDDIGASEGAGTDFSVHVLAGDFDRGVALLADNELHPALPQSAIDIAAGPARAPDRGAQPEPGLSRLAFAAPGRCSRRTIRRCAIRRPKASARSRATTCSTTTISSIVPTSRPSS